MNQRVANFRTRVYELSPSCLAGASDLGDVLAAPEAIGPLAERAALAGEIVSLTVLCKDDHPNALDVLFFSGSVTLGTEGSAVSISDADAEKLVGALQVATWIDLINSRFAHPGFVPIPFNLNAGEQLHVGLVDRTGGATFTATGVFLRVGIRTF